MTECFIKYISIIYRKLFVGIKFYKFNRLLFDLSVRGLGILNFENDKVSGEEFFFRKFLAGQKNPVVIDVGANEGDYSVKLMDYCPDAIIYACEPHPKTFELLKAKAAKHNFRAFNLGFSDSGGTMKLFDRVSEAGGTQHASLYQEVIEAIHQTEAIAFDVHISTIDQFVAEHGISRIHLLKIDTEGNELKVLRGANQTLACNMVDIVQIEFNEMNAVSRVFFRDFYALLHNYDCYRLLPDGLIPIQVYNPLHCELFAFQNYLFLRRDNLLKGQDKIRC
jgi:FkbM family methyltransferase